MADFTTTTNFALKKPTVGQAVDLWGIYINSNFDEIDTQLQALTVSIQTPDLEGLGNVLNTTPATNDFLRFNGESWAAATVSIPSSIDDLSDVDTSTTSPTTNQVLTWNGSKFIPASPSNATIADASITTAKLDTGLQTQINRILVTDDDDTPTNGQILQYSTADTEWKYADLPGSTVVTLSDVNSGALADNALLVYNSSAGEFQFESGSTLRTTLGVDPAGTDNSTDISISSSTSFNYITLSGQVLTLNQVDLQTDVANTLPISSGGTGSTTASAARTALGFGTISTQDSDDVTITGGNISGIVDLAIADGGTGASSVGAARTNLGLGALATQDTITESQISDLGSYITASSTDTLTNKSGNISQWTNDAGYLTAETNDLTNVSGTLAIANGGTGSTTASGARTALGVDPAGTDNSTDVTLATVTGNYLSLSGQQITAGTVPVTLGGTGSTTASDARTALGVDPAGTDNSTNVTLVTTSHDYLSLSAQAITLGPIVLSTDVSGTLPVANGGTGVTSLASLNAADLGSNNGVTDATDGYVLTADGIGGVAWEAATGGGSGSYIEHSSTVSDALTISAGTNRMYIGGTTFSGSGTMAGRLVTVGGAVNFTGSVNTTGVLVNIGVP